MSVAIVQESDSLNVMRISGVLKKSEMDAAQKKAAAEWKGSGGHKVLVIIENFAGWEKSEDWNDMTFYIEHREKIAKIAIVGDPKLEAEMMMFAGAGFRPSPVRYFSPNQLEQARQWLA